MKTGIFLAFISLLLFTSCTKNYPYITNDGLAQGTTYHIVYQPVDGKDLQTEIDAELLKFDYSLSTYNPNSIISRMNQNDTAVNADELFIKCFNRAIQVSELSGGAFDITVAPLVNAWGFGFKNKVEVTKNIVDSIMQFIGYQKVKLLDGKLIKNDPRLQIDANAIAQGFSVDLVAEMFENKGIKNYLVEIGGEVRSKGVNSKGKIWRVGIDKPVDGSEPENRELQSIIKLEGKSISTSGSYRKFYVKDGVKYSHTINPKTGYPAQSRLLSASILADDCMTADAFATVCMVNGVEGSIAFQKQHPEVEMYLIFTDSTNQYATYATEGFKKVIEEMEP